MKKKFTREYQPMKPWQRVAAGRAGTADYFIRRAGERLSIEIFTLLKTKRPLVRKAILRYGDKVLRDLEAGKPGSMERALRFLQMRL